MCRGHVKRAIFQLTLNSVNRISSAFYRSRSILNINHDAFPRANSNMSLPDGHSRLRLLTFKYSFISFPFIYSLEPLRSGISSILLGISSALILPSRIPAEGLVTELRY